MTRIRMVRTMAEYIERERTVELLRSLGNREYRKEKGTIQDAIKMISYPEYTPAADVAPIRHGRWIGIPLCGSDDCECSECGNWCNIHVNLCGEAIQKYCPYCGAKMDGGANNAVG